MAEDTANGEAKKPRTLYTDTQKRELLQGYEDAPNKSEYKAKHGIYAGQILRWRSQFALQAAGHEETPKKKPGRKPRAERPASGVIAPKEVAAYFTALEARVAALERFELRFTKFLGGK